MDWIPTQCNRLQVESDIQVDRGDDVSGVAKG